AFDRHVATTSLNRASSRISAPNDFTVGLPVMISAKVAPILVSAEAESLNRGDRTRIEIQMLPAAYSVIIAPLAKPTVGSLNASITTTPIMIVAAGSKPIR